MSVERKMLQHQLTEEQFTGEGNFYQLGMLVIKPLLMVGCRTHKMTEIGSYERKVLTVLLSRYSGQQLALSIPCLQAQ